MHMCVVGVGGVHFVKGKYPMDFRLMLHVKCMSFVHMPLNEQEGLLSLVEKHQGEEQWQEEIKYCTNKLLLI